MSSGATTVWWTPHDEVGKLMPNNTIDQTGMLGHEQYKKLVMNPGSMVIKIYQKR